MDAREKLRQYLEQRRDAGETELVLDQLTVSQVLQVVGARAALSPAPARTAGSPRQPAAAEAPVSTPPPGHASADWREVLRSAGAEPGERATARRDVEAAPTADTPSVHPTPAPPAPAAPVPAAGISVGGSSDMFASMSHLDSLDAVAQSVASCTRCPLYATATNPVPGVGNPNAGLLIVGEAPGATEDERGEPFVGAAGQLLTKILAAVDLRREDVFIANVLKHRPPGNRNPMPDEVSACSPYLFRQFELLRPKAILALGTFAAQTLLQTKLAIGKLRGQVHRFHGVPLIVTYHPAALLRNPSWKRPTWEDVQLVRRILDSAIVES